MKVSQIVVVEQGQVELQSLDFDASLAPTEFLIRAERTFISAGTELSIYTGTSPGVRQKGSWCAYPFRPGYANVGMVEQVGGAVSRVSKGQRVFSFGAHASHVKCSQDDLVVAVPGGMDPGVAAASRMAGVATSAMVLADRSRHHPVVLVFGLGMVGNLAAQAFQILGGKVVGVDPLAARRRLAERCGIARTLDGGGVAEVKQALHHLVGREQADICIDASGLTPVVVQALALTANIGQLILLGTPRTPSEGNLTAVFHEIHSRNIAVRGALEWCLPAYTAKAFWGDRTPPLLSICEKQQMIFDWILDGRIAIEPLISHRLSPARIRDAYEGLLHSPSEYTGVVIEWE